MSIDFSAMTPKALQKLIAEATREHKRKKKRAPIARVRSKVTRLAKAEGYTIEELFGTAGSAAPASKATRRKTTAPKRKVPAKYRNPANADETWTGRGRAPIWLRDYLEAGRNKDEFLIK